MTLAALLLGLITFGFYSCSTDEDAQWRDDNLAFFDSLGDNSDVLAVGDSINGFPGVYYKVLEAGTGEVPIIGNLVKVSYAGWLWNDTTKYNSSLALDDAFDSNQIGFTCRVGSGVIDGWSVVLQRMPVGAKWRVFIPYYLAYGAAGSSSIAPYSTLIFDMKLLEITSDN